MAFLQREIAEQILPFYTFAVFVFGTAVGSFLNVVVWRLPRGESLIHPPSHCPKCDHAIRPWENIPVLSWLMLRGRCSKCGLSISVRYPLVEAATGLVFLVMWYAIWARGLPLTNVFGFCFLGAALLAITLIDLEHLLIPNDITFSGMILALILALAFPETHIRPSVLSGIDQEPLLFGGLLELVSHAWPAVREHWRAMALGDALLGMGFGYGVLWMILEFSTRLWGRYRCRLETPAPGRFDADGVHIGTELKASWDEALIRRNDRFVAFARDVEIIRRKNEGRTAFPEAKLVLTAEGVSVGENHWEWGELKGVHGSVLEWISPREVMGYGDLKLLAMVGAFLGADATIFIMLMGAFFGCAVGISGVVMRPERRHSPIPFGPFIALATVLWLVYGPRLFNWYAGTLMRLISR